MDTNSKKSFILPYMAYGDAVGFLTENIKDACNSLQPFEYGYGEGLNLQVEKGQWSYITQLMLINCKCLTDNKEKRRVLIDYKRMIEEIKLWTYYRLGTPLNYMHKLKLGKKYYESDFYWSDKRGEAFSRIIPICLANKNFNAAQEEVYKNIIYTNRHPQVILTGLLLLRITYSLFNNTTINKDELIDDLKNYLIHLQLTELEESINTQLPNNYRIKFEQEKINYLIDLDRAKGMPVNSFIKLESKDIFITSLTNFFMLNENIEDTSGLYKAEEKEIYAITYGLLALTKNIEESHISEIKDIDFIKNMDNYLLKLREYEVGRAIFEKIDSEIDLFNLNKGDVLKHPLLNNIRVKDKKKLNNYIELIVESKSGEYRFIRY